MAEKRMYFGSAGPYLYDDEDTIDHEDDGDFHGKNYTSVQTDGTVRASGEPTDDDDLVRKKDFDNMDGDVLDITFEPENYTPDDYTPEAEDIDDLAAHLKGIDDELGLKADAGGWTGTFTNGDGDIVTVEDGLITDVSS